MATVTPEFQRAVADHEAGKLDVAERVYRQVLAQNPNHSDALHLLGVLLHQRGRHAEALELIKRAIALVATNAAYYSNQGLVLRALGRRDEAVATLLAAIKVDPAYIGSYKNLGTTLNELGRHDEAATVLQKLVGIQPRDFGSWKQLGIANYRRRQFPSAIEAFQKAIELNGQDAETQNNLGVCFKDSGRLAEAEAAYRQAIAVRPNYAEAHNNLGILFSDQGNARVAIESFREALRHNAKLLDARHNLGVTLRDLGEFEEAGRYLAEVLEVDPSHAEAHNNTGVNYQHQGLYDLALRHYEHALRAKPDHIWAHFNRSQVWLLQGRYPEGFLEYEWRWKRPGLAASPFPRPLWDGSDRPHQTILLHAEQGLGDTIQFLRYVPLVCQRVGKVIIECQAPLVNLLAGYPGVAEFVAKGSPLPDFDLHSPFMSLAAIFGSRVDTLPGQSPYLAPSEGLAKIWKDKLAALPGRKFGINWQGNPKYHRDAQRSFPLAALAPLAAIPDVTLVSLQKIHGREQLAEIAERFQVVDLAPDLDEANGPFMDTAAVITALDLVVTSDTATAHLAGAIGAPTWLAVSHSPDWRWHDRGETSPWYPSMRLFRQSTPGDWTGVFQRMAEELKAR